jgi:hypothetical protein
MRAYLVTEFTDLYTRPQMLSLGLVTEASDGREFYAEVTDPDRLRATGWFGLCAVLPQFGRVANASCTYAELGARLSAFLSELASGLKRDEFVDIACVEGLDRQLFDRALKRSFTAGRAPAWWRVRAVIVDELTGYGAGTLAAQAHFHDQAHGPISRHHALCDARALRMACEASRSVMAGARSPSLRLDERAIRATAG